MEKISINSEPSQYPNIRKKLKDLVLFKLISPKGGQHNDGYTLKMTATFPDKVAILLFLDFLNFQYRLIDNNTPLTEEEKKHTFTKNKIGLEENSFIIFKTWTKFEDKNIFLQLYENGVTVIAGGWYEVDLRDVEIAIILEKAIKKSGHFNYLF